MPNTLALDDDDWGPIDVVGALEAAFDLKFTKEDIENPRTIGGIHALLQRQIGQGSSDAQSCFTAMTFYRLRRALRALDDRTAIRPSSNLASFAGQSAKALLDNLAAQTGLQMPKRHLSLIGYTGVFLILGTIVAFIPTAILFPAWWPALVAAFAAGIALGKLDPGHIPTQCKTMEGLTRKVAALNYGKLIKEGARVRENDIWTAVTEVLSGYTSLPKAEMRSDTLLLRKQPKAA